MKPHLHRLQPPPYKTTEAPRLQSRCEPHESSWWSQTDRVTDRGRQGERRRHGERKMVKKNKKITKREETERDRRGGWREGQGVLWSDGAKRERTCSCLKIDAKRSTGGVDDDGGGAVDLIPKKPWCASCRQDWKCHGVTPMKCHDPWTRGGAEGEGEWMGEARMV